MKSLLLMVPVLALAGTMSVQAFTGNGTLTLVTPATGVNKLNVTVTATASGQTTSDTETSNVTGTIDGSINADPTTGATTELTITSGNISLSNMNFVLRVFVIVTVADVTTSGLGGTAFTPAPPAPVTPNASGGTFNASLHRILINRGTVSGTALGNPVSSDFSTAPFGGTGSGTGTVVMVAGAADSTHRTFQSTVTVPVDFTDTIDLGGTPVTIRAVGSIRAAGPVRIPLNGWIDWTSANGLAGASFTAPISPGAAPLGLAWACGHAANVPATTLTPALQSASPAPRSILTLPPSGTRGPVWVEFSNSLAAASWSVAPASSVSSGTNPLPTGTQGTITVQLPAGVRAFTRLRARQP